MYASLCAHWTPLRSTQLRATASQGSQQPGPKPPDRKARQSGKHVDRPNDTGFPTAVPNFSSKYRVYAQNPSTPRLAKPIENLQIEDCFDKKKTSRGAGYGEGDKTINTVRHAFKRRA